MAVDLCTYAQFILGRIADGSGVASTEQARTAAVGVVVCGCENAGPVSSDPAVSRGELVAQDL
jgi:hypothetical protein